MRKMQKRKKANYYAKILIAVSITLLLYGVFLDFKNEIKLWNPITDATPTESDNSNTTIDINTSGKNPEKTPTKTPEKTPEKTPTKEPEKTPAKEPEKEPEKTPTETPSQPENQNQGNNNQQQQEPHIPTLEETNDSFRQEIQNNYGITIKYGSETDGYVVGGLSTTSISSSTTISTTLTKLNDALSLYPSGMFQEIRDGGIPLTVYLIERYSMNGVTGVTDSNAYYANISIAVDYPFEESFYHESYHYIERYMIDRVGLTFNNWNGYNPPGFVYGNTNSELSYASNGHREDSYFVNNYAQTAEGEDRASTFEYMMDYSKASCLNQNQPVWKKAKLMSQAIEIALNTCSPSVTEYWERFL